MIPGATVTLISEARGTRSSPVVTTDTGDFVFVNMVADTYTVEVTLQSFKTLKRSGIAVSPEGNSVYDASENSNAHDRFDRDTSPGLLTPQG